MTADGTIDRRSAFRRKMTYTRFFVAILLGSLVAAVVGLAVFIGWGLALNPDRGPFESPGGDFIAEATGIAIFAAFLFAGVLLMGGPPAALIGRILLLTGHTSLRAFLIGALLAGLTGYFLTGFIRFFDFSPFDTVTSDIRTGYLPAILTGALFAGWTGHRFLIGRPAP